MDIVVSALIGLGALFAIWLPLVGKKEPGRHPQKETDPGLARELEKRRDQTYAAIKELEFDYQMGKLTPGDYQEVRARYEETAVSLLEQLDRVKKGQVALGPLCPSCGATLEKASQFCSQCGAGLPQFCSGCGSALEEGDRFCSYCGQAVSR